MSSEADYAAILQETREALANRRGWFGRIRREDRFTASPSRGDDLHSHLAAQKVLLRKGTVVWAALVQANNRLFELDNHWYPGEVLCSDDPHFDAHPGELRKLCSAIFELKGTEPTNPELRRIADDITGELARSAGAPLPQTLLDIVTTGGNVRRHTIIFDRSHLPDGVLVEDLMPVLQHERTNHVMLLPAKAWGPRMLQLWQLPEAAKQDLQRQYEKRERERRQRPLIEVSNRALAQFKQIAKQNNLRLFVRIEYRGGHNLLMAGPESIGPSDHRLTIDDVTFIMDPQSADEIWGCKLDWVEAGESAGFMFDS